MKTDSQDVIVIGAGVAGLTAARELCAGGLKVAIVEARERIGGRILTVPGRFGIPVELGAEFIHGRPNETWPVVRRAGLTAFDVADGHLLFDRGRLRECKDMWEELEKITGRLKKAKPNDSFATFLRQHCRGKQLATARRVAIAFVEGFHAARIERISVDSLIKAEQAAEGEEGEKSFRLLNGYASVPQAIFDSIPASRRELLLNTVVRRIAWRRGQVTVYVESPAGRSLASLSAPRAVVTLPLGVLQAPRGDRAVVTFDPELGDKRAAIQGLAMGSVVRLAIFFKSAFWEDEKLQKRLKVNLSELSFIHAPDQPFLAYWTTLPMRTPVLMAWSAGSAGEKLIKSGKAEILDAALRMLGRILRMQPRRIRAQLTDWQYHDWSADRFARGAYSYIPTGAIDGPQRLAAPLAQTLYFAGEATDSHGDWGTVHGAIRSGERVAKEILASVRRHH